MEGELGMTFGPRATAAEPATAADTPG
jgi:hypothetical protein